ncbi:MAG: D-alanine--D-alanine ligase family protein [Bacillota bacterium]
MAEAERIGIGILFGGPSGEHEVSIMSARAIWKAIDPVRYRPYALPITRDGGWYWISDPNELFEQGRVDRDPGGCRLKMIPGPGGGLFAGENRLDIDVVFPVLHGPFGEDGSVQGLLEILGLPYVGAGVASSGVSMDKQLMKALFTTKGIPQVDYICFRGACEEGEYRKRQWRVEAAIGYPCFVKPAALGSSLGITRVESRDTLGDALKEALRYGDKVLVEPAVNARELECSVLGNELPQVAGPGEILPAGPFYDYNSKYFDDRTKLLLPAPVTAEVAERARELSVAAFEAVDAKGMARVDMFYVEKEDQLLVNEINTIPGFTPMSMYPRLWMERGMSFSDLVDRLIDLVLQRGYTHD